MWLQLGIMKRVLLLIVCLISTIVIAQENEQDGYKKRVLESTELDLISSYYRQDGKNAAVTGGIGTEELTDAAGSIVVSIPLSDDEVLSVEAGISAYTSASSSNVNPFDGNTSADPFVASTGASRSDTWKNFRTNYSHSSNDRNSVWNGTISVSSEYDYFSIGAGMGYTRIFNERNTEFSANFQAFFDTWKLIYPIELRPFENPDPNIPPNFAEVIGYLPDFKPHKDKDRNSFALSLGISQILTKKIQGILLIDFISQRGLLSTPFQRVYFTDAIDYYFDGFHLADDIEQLPNTRFKTSVGGRVNFYLSETVVFNTFYRYYLDDWGIESQTVSLEIPIKLNNYFTVYPSYRYYQQTQADYFAPYNLHISTERYYTSDYDLSDFRSNQFGFGIRYTDILTRTNLWKAGIKNIDLFFHKYDRNSSFAASIVTLGFNFIVD